ncbi:MAG TPA: DUF3520 domain-containing protein, partial [Polyangiaceae bacterium]|nr:DUF3520 domain-containing protein [Polyangiaceae bacterium]
IQVEFDPRIVQSYRLIGYENRDVADEDFRNDKVDAGEIGAGHDVTALYDVVLKGRPSRDRSPVIVRVRHKKPQGHRAVEMAVRMSPDDLSTSFASAPASYRFAVGVVGFAEVLRKSPHAKSWSLATVERIVDQARWGQREQNELLALVRTARRLSPEPKRGGPAIMAK